MPPCFTRSARAVCLALALLTGAGWGTAQAVIVTVSGVDYDVRLGVANGSFLDIRDTIIEAPWWGDIALAQAFGSAFSTATGGDFSISAGIDTAIFAISEDGPLLLLTWFVEEPPGSAFGVIARNDIGQGPTHAFAFVAPVPEIDGKTLPMALFVLFTLGVGLHVRRLKRAGV